MRFSLNSRLSIATTVRVFTRVLAPLTAVAALLFSLITGVISQAADDAALSSPWKHQDVGAAEVKGSARFANGVFTLQGTRDTWGTNDGFQFVWQQWNGDGEIVARVTAVENTQGHAKAGIMFRESLDAGARHATAAVTPGDGSQFLKRSDTGDKTTSSKTGLDKGVFPFWLKLVRAGNQFSSFESKDGKTWRPIGNDTVAMAPRAYVGLVTSSHQPAILCTATLDSVTLKKP
jgi:hypothetical protein